MARKIQGGEGKCGESLQTKAGQNRQIQIPDLIGKPKQKWIQYQKEKLSQKKKGRQSQSVEESNKVQRIFDLRSGYDETGERDLR